jgi:transcription antitermination protein NusB
MKNPLDPRHKKRQTIVEDLFRIEFHKQRIGLEAKKIIDQKDFIDGVIQKAATEFPIDKINKVDLAILRLAVYELLIVKEEPPRAIIDEAVELAKEYGGDTSPSFVNGALGKILENDKLTRV